MGRDNMDGFFDTEKPSIEHEEASVEHDDIETRVQNAVTEAITKMMGAPAPGPQSFEDALAHVDPADSEAALAMLDFLLKTGRLGRVGVLDNGGGYLFMYQEPKGSSKQGYVPGATQGDRIVDQAVEAQRNANGGAGPAKRGVCKHCISAVVEVEGVGLVIDGAQADDSDGAECESSPDGAHHFA